MRNLTTGLAQRADCSDEPLDASYFRCWSEPERARLGASGVGGSGDPGHMIGTAAPDPDVWSGRASQEVFIDLSACGLASMYPASDWSVLCSGPSWISARLRSHYRTGLERAIWVTRVRRRREDRSSISFHPLADLGRKTGTMSSLSP